MDYNFNFRINIDDRIIGFLKRVVVRRNLLIALAAVIAGSTIFVFGAQITKQYTFTTGTTISATEVNKNFDDLFTKVNALDTQVTTLDTQVTALDTQVTALDTEATALGNSLYFPDGFSTSTITTVLTTIKSPANNYIVPSGKRLYIIRLKNASSTLADFSSGPNIYYTLSSTENKLFLPPLVFNSSTLTTPNPMGIEITGFLVDSNATTTPVNTSVNSSTPYTVPAQKKLYLYSAYGSSSGYLRINGIDFVNGLYGNFVFDRYPLILPQGTVISTDGTINIVGILK